MTFEGVFNYYPVCIAGEEGIKKVDGKAVNTGMYDVTVLCLDNGCKTNTNGLYVSGGRTANISINFKVKKEIINKLHFLKPLKCLAELTPTSFDFFIKVKAVEIDGKWVSVESEVNEE